MANDKEIKELIIKTLIHNPKASFSDLCDKSIPSNEFTYHLNKLIDEGIVSKNENKKYSLTTLGQRFESELDGKTGKKRDKPFLAVLLVVKKENQYLLYHRLKEPFYDLYGMPGAKLDFGEEVLQGAERELNEETGLEGKGKVIAINNILTYEKEIPLTHFTQFVVLFDNASGKLIEENREGSYKFVEQKEFKIKYKENRLFPDNLLVFNIVENYYKEQKLKMYELKMFKEGNKFFKIEHKEII